MYILCKLVTCSYVLKLMVREKLIVLTNVWIIVISACRDARLICLFLLLYWFSRLHLFCLLFVDLHNSFATFDDLYFLCHLIVTIPSPDSITNNDNDCQKQCLVNLMTLLILINLAMVCFQLDKIPRTNRV